MKQFSVANALILIFAAENLLNENAFFYLFKILLFFFHVVEKEDQYRVITSYEATNIGETSLVEGALVSIIEKNERGRYFLFKSNNAMCKRKNVCLTKCLSEKFLAV